MEILTARCRVRPFKPEDIDAFMAYRNDMAWMRHQGYKGLTRAAYEGDLLAPPSPERGMQLAVTARQGGALLGDIYLRREGDAWWLGYTIAPAEARRGYAFEAASGVITRLWEQGAARINAGVLPENTASIRLLEGLGFVDTGHMEDGERVFTLALGD